MSILHQFSGKDGTKYFIKLLSKEYATNNVSNIESIINTIPNASADKTFILSTRYYNKNFKYKWNLSFVCIDNNNHLVSVLLSYYKFADQHNPFDSVYLHRLAVINEHRRNFVATNLLNFALSFYFCNLAWLNYITIQLTVNPINSEALNLYKKFGFKRFGTIKYRHKKDIVMFYSRYFFNNSGIESSNINKSINLIKTCKHPRFKKNSFISGQPKFYFFTGSTLKRKQLAWLLSLYNIKSSFYSPPVDFFEPQIDNLDEQTESSLVISPLKQISRFISFKYIPLLVEDTMLFIEKFNNDFDNNPVLPGLDTKRWWQQLGNHGILNLLKDSSLRRAKYVSLVGCFLSNKRYLVGKSVLRGTISYDILDSPNSHKNFPMTNPFYFHKIFIPDGYNKSLAELSAQHFTYLDYRNNAIYNLLAKLYHEHIIFSSRLPLL